MSRSLLGTRVVRREDPALITGAADYTHDIDLPNALVARFVRSTIAHALIRRIDLTSARAMPGVVALHTVDTLGLGQVTARFPVDAHFHRFPLASERVRFVGESVVLVIAETEAQADDAAEAVEIEYEATTVATDPEAVLASGQALLFPDRGSDVSVTRFGADETLHDAADVIVNGRFENQRIAVVPMEGHAIAVRPDVDGRLTIWLATQGAHTSRNGLAASLGIDRDQIHLIAPWVGGGFGAKGGWQPEHVAVAQAARLLQRPVRWIESRLDNVQTMHARDQIQYVRLGATRDGRFTSLEALVVADAGAYHTVGAMLPGGTRRMSQGVYEIPKVQVDTAIACTNKAPLGAFRGAGRPEATALVERAVDLLALELGIDPLELRLRNVLEPDVFPYTTKTGVTYDTGAYAMVLREAARLANYDELRRQQAERRASAARHGTPPLLGIGIAAYVEVTGGPRPQEYAGVEVHLDGSATVRVGTASHGQGHETAFCALVADRLGIPFERVEFVQSDTDLVPHGEGTGGSRSGQVGGSAIHTACEQVLDRARHLAAERLEAAPADIVLTDDGQLAVAGVPTLSVGWAELAAIAADSDDGPLAVELDFVQEGATYPFGAHVAVVEVDPDTGHVELVRHIAVDDVGVILNPMIVEGQQHGGVASGVAQALWEQMVYDTDGNPRTGSLAEYAMPSAAELPSFDVHSTVTPTTRNPLGVKGIGEAGTIGSTPAVHNAVIDALSHFGVRHIDMPLTPERVWRAIAAARRDGRVPAVDPVWPTIVDPLATVDSSD